MILSSSGSNCSIRFAFCADVPPQRPVPKAAPLAAADASMCLRVRRKVMMILPCYRRHYSGKRIDDGRGRNEDDSPPPAQIPVVRPLRLPALLIPWSCDRISALERARREAGITRQLAAIVEVTMEYLANQHRRKLRTDRLELIKIVVFLCVDMRRCFILNNRVALRFKSGDH